MVTVFEFKFKAGSDTNPFVPAKPQARFVASRPGYAGGCGPSWPGWAG